MNTDNPELDTIIEQFTEKIIDSAINIDTGVFDLEEGQAYAIAAQNEAKAALDKHYAAYYRARVFKEAEELTREYDDESRFKLDAIPVESLTAIFGTGDGAEPAVTKGEL